MLCPDDVLDELVRRDEFVFDEDTPADFAVGTVRVGWSNVSKPRASASRTTHKGVRHSGSLVIVTPASREVRRCAADGALIVRWGAGVITA